MSRSCKKSGTTSSERVSNAAFAPNVAGIIGDVIDAKTAALAGKPLR